MKRYLTHQDIADNIHAQLNKDRAETHKRITSKIIIEPESYVRKPSSSGVVRYNQERDLYSAIVEHELEVLESGNINESHRSQYEKLVGELDIIGYYDPTEDAVAIALHMTAGIALVAGFAHGVKNPSSIGTGIAAATSIELLRVTYCAFRDNSLERQKKEVKKDYVARLNLIDNPELFLSGSSTLYLPLPDTQ